MLRCFVFGSGRASRSAGRGRKDSASRRWADFADGFGFSVCHMVEEC
jgi:hypothetical protein